MSALDETPPVAPAATRKSRWSLTLTIGLILVGIHVAVALLTLFWTPYDPSATAGGRLEPPSLSHWVGTDRLGRDFFTLIMIGSRIALVVGIGAVAIGAAIGVTIGLLSAFATRFLDDALAATLDILIAFPVLLLAMLVVAASDGASLWSAILALGIAMSAIVARLTRILAKRVLQNDYIIASRTSGTSWPGVVVRHVLPNIWPTLTVNFALQFGIAVIAEASLSYLGLGAPPPNASWGRLLQEAQGTVYTAPIGAIAPGIALVTLVIGVNMLADGLRDIGDPTRRVSR
ncbi:peptide/nickel transport system permease protein [Pseudaminobacter salicylatoxidans]|uniref:Peptide/nickel transport system permease protein n=1 Tax=Pseudaminobacter salicylatoxidans TaxID=93369 RepID=A0A316CWF8_PSESE|nr:ABC transporter permease [Pseudaminobacter salicylatoxidans]PWJ86424.1 peptide/nickel transport system permease protein [Pseudaminobacter salicylatoxidans]